VAGEGSLETTLRETLVSANALEAVRIIGTVSRPRLAQLMNACDVQVITSRYETGPTVGFESLASGLPIATTNVGQVARLVEAGGAGRAVDEHSAAALSRAIEWIVDQPADRLRAAAAASAAPHLADEVLRAIYDDSRALAAAASADADRRPEGG
jgi:glycosyltransferase involved in cell wall biosynthesis